MPNWVRNVLRAKDIVKLPLFATDDDGHVRFDFNALIPMPETLKVTSGGIEDVAVEAVLRKMSTGKLINTNYRKMTDEEYKRMKAAFGMTDDELAEEGLKYITNRVKYGSTTWYDWRIKYWGTKWNACETSVVSDDEIEFETAWSMPKYVMDALAAMFPNVWFEHYWADEDIGSNTGWAGTDCEGGWCRSYYDDCSHEAYDTYVRCWGETEYLKKDEHGCWQYVEDPYGEEE